MSATINAKKIKFHVLGNGFEDVRVTSGKGDIVESDDLGIQAETAIIDNSGKYLWTGNYYTSGKLDLETKTWTQHWTTTDGNPTFFHLCNNDENIGVVWFSSVKKFILFDMTDDTIIAEIPSGSIWLNLSGYQAIKVGQKIYITTVTNGRAFNGMYMLDIDNLSATEYALVYNTGVGGFIDDDTVYGYYEPEWFSQYANNRGMNLWYGDEWSVTAPDHVFPNISQSGLCGNGKLYLPSYVNSAWRMGEYDGNSSSNFVTPKPLRFFGKFSSKPTINHKQVAYNTGKTKACFKTSQGLFTTDFQDIELLTSDNVIPIAMNDEIVIATDSSQNLRRYRYN